MKHVTLQKIVAHDFRYGPPLWLSTADGGMRQAVGKDRSQLFTEIRGESRARDVLVQTDFGWRHCLRNTYLFEIIVVWNVTPCSLTDGTKIVSHTIKYYSLSPPRETHITFTYSLGLWDQWFHLQHDKNPATVLRSGTAYRSWSITRCWLKIYLKCLKETP